MFANPDEAARCALLKRVRTIAVVGLSPDPARPSYGVAGGLQRFGFTIVPVRPGADRILGAQAYPSLDAVPFPIDLVNVFRSAPYVDEVVDQCLALGIKALWIQEGVVNEAAAAERAVAGGMQVVMDRCIYRDYRRNCA